MVKFVYRLQKQIKFSERGVNMRPRGIDEVGRLVIPKPMRNALGINAGDDLDIYTEGSKIIIEKRNPGCVFCGVEENLLKFKGKNICKACFDELINK